MEKIKRVFLPLMFFNKAKFIPARKIQNNKEAGLIIAMLPALNNKTMCILDFRKEFTAIPAKPNAIRQNNSICI
jgi:hypothetical protein